MKNDIDRLRIRMKKLSPLLLAVGCWLLAVNSAYAVVDIGQTFGPGKNFSSISDLLNVLLPNFMVISGIVLFIGIIISGMMTVQSAGSGDAHAAENWKKALVGMIAGFLLIFTGYWIVQIVEFVTGIKIFNPDIK